jgi:hypothetical protein
VDEKPEEKGVDEKPEERCVDEKPEERCVDEKPEEKGVDEKPEERVVENTWGSAELGIEEKGCACNARDGIPVEGVTTVAVKIARGIVGVDGLIE